jgi:hypothetical protein
MSSGYRDGSFIQLCGDKCEADLHFLIERDYEQTPYLWGSFSKVPHDELVARLQPIVDEYHEWVDVESSFFLMTANYNNSRLVTALWKEIREGKRQQQEEGGEIDGNDSGTNPVREV